MLENLDPEQETIPQAEFSRMIREVQLGMAAHLKSSLSEVFFPGKNGPNMLENGTGSFVDVDGAKLLLSNEHVIKNEGLRYSLPEHDRYVRGAYLKHTVSHPIDIGVSRITNDIWEVNGGDAYAIPLSRFALNHVTYPHEILWTAGYPGARVVQLCETHAVAQVLSTQEYIFPEGEVPHELFDPEYHFGVAYSPAKAQRIDQSVISNSPGLSDPHGLSGSLVWNSRRLECFYEGRSWSPSMALVTGMIWGWPSSDYLIATKVEHFRETLALAAQLPYSPPV